MAHCPCCSCVYISGYNKKTRKLCSVHVPCSKIRTDVGAEVIRSFGFDPNTVFCILEHRDVNDKIVSIGFSPDGGTICIATCATPSSPQTLTVWNVHTTICTHTLTGNTEDVGRVEFFYCGNYICASSPNNATNTLHWKLETDLGVDVWRLLTQTEIDRACSKYAKYLNK